MDEEQLNKAKASLRNLLFNQSLEEDFHRKFAQDLHNMPLNVPFKMFFVQHGGEVKNAAIIPEHVVNNLKERDPEENEMLVKFIDPTGVAFEAAGNYLVLSSKLSCFFVFWRCNFFCGVAGTISVLCSW